MSVSTEFGKVVAGVAALQDEQWLTFNAMVGAIQENRAQDAAFYAMEFGLNSPDAAKRLFDYFDQRFLSQDISELFEQVHGSIEVIKETQTAQTQASANACLEGTTNTVPGTWGDVYQSKTSREDSKPACQVPVLRKVFPYILGKQCRL